MGSDPDRGPQIHQRAQEMLYPCTETGEASATVQMCSTPDCVRRFRDLLDVTTSGRDRGLAIWWPHPIGPACLGLRRPPKQVQQPGGANAQMRAPGRYHDAGMSICIDVPPAAPDRGLSDRSCSITRKAERPCRWRPGLSTITGRSAPPGELPHNVSRRGPTEVGTTGSRLVSWAHNGDAVHAPSPQFIIHESRFEAASDPPRTLAPV